MPAGCPGSGDFQTRASSEAHIALTQVSKVARPFDTLRAGSGAPTFLIMAAKNEEK